VLTARGVTRGKPPGLKQGYNEDHPFFFKAPMLSAPVVPQVSSAVASGWSAVRRFCWRLAASYLVVYSIPPNVPPEMLPGLGWLIKAGVAFWHAVLSFVGIHIANLAQAPPQGFLPGDTIFGVVRIACCLVLAVAAAVIWTLFDWNGNRQQAEVWVRVCLRYVLGLAMVGYGLAKVIEVQYPPLELEKMLRPIGDLTPMGLLWTFMQGSRIYTLFAGLVEITGGLLLFFRRTVTVGALLTTASLVNVVVINFGYDIAVKLYSTHLLLISLFLLAPDLGRLTDVLVLNRPVIPKRVVAHPSPSGWARYSKLGVKMAILAIALFGMTDANLQRAKWFGKHVTNPPLYGVYNVDGFRRGNEIAPPLLTDGARWKNAVFQARGPAGRSWLSVQMMNDAWQQYRTEYDTSRRMISVTDPSGINKKGVLNYSQPQNGHVLLTGTLNNQPLAIELKRVDDSQYSLLRRDVHLLQPRGNQVLR
jgi:YD repeat-containing protein